MDQWSKAQVTVLTPQQIAQRKRVKEMFRKAATKMPPATFGKKKR